MLPLKYTILDIIAQNFSVFIILDRQAYLFQFNRTLLWTIFARSFGLSGLRTIGLSDYRTIEPSHYWSFRVSGLRIIGPSDYRTFGRLLGLRTSLSDLRTVGPSDQSIGPSDCWAFGLLGRHPNNNVIRLSFQLNSNILLNKVHKC